MLLDHQTEYNSQWAAMRSIAQKVGCTAETLRKWVRKSEIDPGNRNGTSSTELERLKALERENRELKQANEILRKAAAFCPGGARPPTEEITVFIEEQREQYGVEPLCRY